MGRGRKEDRLSNIRRLTGTKQNKPGGFETENIKKTKQKTTKTSGDGKEKIVP